MLRRPARRGTNARFLPTLAVTSLLFLCVGVAVSAAALPKPPANGAVVNALGTALANALSGKKPPPPPPDTTPPTVSITSPADGSRVSGRLTITATASDAGGVAFVQFRLDGLDLGTADRLSPYEASLDTTKLDDGPHVLAALARDKAGNRTFSSPVTVTVDNTFTIAVAGPMETVYQNATQSCFRSDFADQPVRAFRLANGQVMLYGGSGGSGEFDRTSLYPNRKHVVLPFYGPDLNHLDATRADRCAERPIFYSNQDSSNPSQFNDRQWLGGGYTEDGKTIYALVHHEFHGNDITKYPFCFDSAAVLIERKCWYTSVNMAISTDGGHSFTQPAPPRQLVAPAPMRWEATCNAGIQDQCGKVGYNDPSNIIKKDGYYYAFIQAIRLGDPGQGNATNCLIRTRNLADASSWRAFSGFDAQGNPTFNTSFVNPYFSSGPPDAHRCKSVDYPHIERMSNSITYNTYLQKYLLIGFSVPGGKDTDGFYYAVSNDLVHWSQQRKFEGLPPSDHAFDLTCGPGVDINPVYYPSLLDPTSTSRSFETSGDQPYLYFTLTHYLHNDDGSCTGQVPDRDLLRFPLKISYSTP